MKTLKHYLIQRPIISSLILVIVFVVLPFSISSIFSYFFGFILTDIRFTIYNAILSALLIWILVKNQWIKKAGLTVQMSNWNPRWWIWTMILGLYTLLQLTGINWSDLTFSTTKVIEWLALWVSVGLKEELLYRGVILFILYQYWGNTRFGLAKACILQAVLFSIIHYINALAGFDISSIHTQVIMAFFMGIAYGSLYLISRSIWPVVLVHTLHDAILSMNSTFGTVKIEMAQSINTDIIPYIIFNAVIYSLFGVFCLMKSSLNDTGPIETYSSKRG